MQVFSNPFFKNTEEGISQFFTILTESQNDLIIDDLESSNISKLLGKLMVENDTSKVEQLYDASNDEPDLYDDMSKLKDRILGLLQGYKNTIKEKETHKEIRKQIRQDAKYIKSDYSQIIEKINQSVECSMISNDTSYFAMANPKQEQEMNNMFNLVEEFLEKFDGKKAKHDLYTSMIQQTFQDSQIIDDSQLQSNHNYDFQLNNSDTSLLVSQVKRVDDTFYNAGDAHTKLEKKIDDIKLQLQKIFKNESFQYSQTIILEALDNLSKLLKIQESENIKIRIEKIEMEIKKIGQGSSTMKLYQLLQQAVETSQQFEEASNGGKQQQVPVKQNEDPGQRRRKFFDVALKFKSQLPANHPGKKMLVSIIYDEVLDEGIPENNWNSWLESRVQKM